MERARTLTDSGARARPARRRALSARAHARLSRRARSPRRPHLPEYPAVPRHDGARKSLGRAAQHADARVGLHRCSACSACRLPRAPSARRSTRRAHWLDRIGLIDRADDPAGALPYGAQRRLEIARAMCTEPVLLCLDEPAAGLNPRESAELNELLLAIRDEYGISILLIEHDMCVVMEISDHIVVLDYGVKIADGTPDAGAQRPEGDRGLSRRRRRGRSRSRSGRQRMSAAMTRPAAVDARRDGLSTARIQALEGRRSRRQRGRDRHPDRRQRRRQIDADDDGLRQSARPRGRDHVRRPRHHPDADRTRSRGWHRACARRPAHFPAHDRAAKICRWARVASTRPPISPSDLERVLALFPRLKERLDAARRHACRAASSRCWRSRRALMSRPRLLLLDEPSLGLAPLIVRQIFDAIRTLNRERRPHRVSGRAERLSRAASSPIAAMSWSMALITLSGTGRELLERPEIKRRLSRRRTAAASRMTPAFSIAGLLYQEESFGVVPSGHASSSAAARRRSPAAPSPQTWRPWWQVVAYALILGAAARFIHFALFDGTLLSLHYYAGRQRRLPASRSRLPAPRAERRWSSNIAGSTRRCRPVALAPQIATELTLRHDRCRMPGVQAQENQP